MALMMLNVVFSGIGAGFENMLMYVIVAVFLAGLMVGRTPEYLGKKVEAKEVKLAMIAILVHPLLICAGLVCSRRPIGGPRRWPTPARTASARSSTSSTSAAANNGSGFEGLADNNPRLEHRHGDRPAPGPVPRLDLAAGVGRFARRQEACARDDRHIAGRQPDVCRNVAGDRPARGSLVVHARGGPRGRWPIIWPQSPTDHGSQRVHGVVAVGCSRNDTSPLGRLTIPWIFRIRT